MREKVLTTLHCVYKVLAVLFPLATCTCGKISACRLELVLKIVRHLPFKSRSPRALHVASSLHSERHKARALEHLDVIFSMSKVKLWFIVHSNCWSLSLDPENNTCFGGGFGRFITKYILGYEMMIIASFKNLLPASQGLRTCMVHYHFEHWI